MNANLDPSSITAGVNVIGLELKHSALDPSIVVEGSPTVGWAMAGTGFGVWEHSVGVSTDIEVDEVFLVLSGSGRVEFEGERASLMLEPGTLASLEAGEKTVWTITQTLRKVFWSGALGHGEAVEASK